LLGRPRGLSFRFKASAGSSGRGLGEGRGWARKGMPGRSVGGGDERTTYSPIFSCRSLQAPKSAFESFICTPPKNPFPTSSLKLRITSAYEVGVRISYPAAKRWQVSRQIRTRDLSLTREIMEEVVEGGSDDVGVCIGLGT